MTLLLAESLTLAECEAVIERGLQTFVEVGNALLTIRDGRLYRAIAGTFEDYCRERWNMSRPRAYQLIDAAMTVTNLSTTVDILPTSERQIRPLTYLEPVDQQTVWQEIIEKVQGGKITAAIVQKIVNEYKPHVAQNSGENEWYTPAEYIVAARAVMGRIDVDPASSAKANEIVQATTYYTVRDNGLTHDWYGRVWMNPPYASPLIGQFVTALSHQVKRGNTVEAIVLVNNATETQWFQDLSDIASAFVFPEGRIKFYGPSGEAGAPLQGQAFVYIGEQPSAFIQHFKGFGWAARI